MRWDRLLLFGGLASAGLLAYGALVESKRLVLVRRTLRLNNWPGDLNGYRIALLADFHVRDQHSVHMARRACEMVASLEADIVIIAGDLVGYWKPESPWQIGEALEPLRAFAGRILAVPGNHEYWGGTADLLKPVCKELGIRLLRNESHRQGGIRWCGVDSLNAGMASVSRALGAGSLGSAEIRKPKSEIEPTVAIWHEPDAVGELPPGVDLMLSGHSHGGQFLLAGWPPMTSRNGRKYLRGFYPEAPTPLYVTSGVGTTGPPSRFGCPPEVVLLTIESAQS